MGMALRSAVCRWQGASRRGQGGAMGVVGAWLGAGPCILHLVSRTPLDSQQGGPLLPAAHAVWALSGSPHMPPGRGGGADQTLSCSRVVNTQQ